MTIQERLKDKIEEIRHLAAKHGAHSVRVFGSVARGDADDSSDLDLLAELEPGRSLLDLGGLQFELELLLGCRVDVVTERGLKKRIRDRVIEKRCSVRDSKERRGRHAHRPPAPREERGSPS